MRFESGAHSKSFTSFSTFVSCCASPPSVEIAYSCFLPSAVPGICPGRSERNTIHFPSGDHAGFVLDFLAVVSACVSPVAISAIHKFLSNAFSSQLVFCTSYTTLFPSGEILGLDALCHSSDWSIVGTVDAGVGAVLAASCATADRKSTRLNSSHRCISYAVFCLKKKKK